MNAKTDLSEWLVSRKMSEFEMSFREQEIHTLAELKECKLTEVTSHSYNCNPN